MTKIWHNYLLWEDYKAGMWRIVTTKERMNYFAAALLFTGCAEIYGSFMLRVVDSWPISCEQNLTDVSSNRRAWIGQAACAFAIKCPEYITRQAWGRLTDFQRDAANKKADEAIIIWEQNHVAENKNIYKQMAFSGV